MSVEAGLPIGEDRLRIAIDQQIKQYGMDQLTNRKIRENLKAEFNIDFSAYKAAINRITMDVVQNGVGPAKEEKKTSSLDSDSDPDVEDAHPVKKKKSDKNRKRGIVHDSDSELLEVGQRRRRAAPAPKRTGGRKRKDPSEPRAKRKKNAFTAYCALSEELADLVGKPYCARFVVVKTMWNYFKDHNLMDPKDKRFVLADEKLFKIFKKRRFLAFGMMKELKNHIKLPKELYEADRVALEKFAEEEEARRVAECESGNTKISDGHFGERGKGDAEADVEDDDDETSEKNDSDDSEDGSESSD